MMKAEHWLNRNGVWYKPGDFYDDGTPEVETAGEPEAKPQTAEKKTRKRSQGGGQRGRNEKAADTQDHDGR